MGADPSVRVEGAVSALGFLRLGSDLNLALISVGTEPRLGFERGDGTNFVDGGNVGIEEVGRWGLVKGAALSEFSLAYFARGLSSLSSSISSSLEVRINRSKGD